ncbi:MAG: tRNA (adenosine(37)-N6)-threonylcarbamoyltransferase complex ATPase subunit type 1 TsaE [Gammaproteobacteria bacterium]|nr:tRNA (adenosine(37)-N6)-threonylcarbamoyltransferase complex ATPase subunit type 1 TsaE [Gammaproteobacteria bacterium]
MAQSRTLTLADPAATERLGHAVAQALVAQQPVTFSLYLEGELGAGKTAFARALLAGLGYEGRVPSPTYTLVEPYSAAGFQLLHADLYRLEDPAELEALGIADQFGPGCLLLVEWPVRGQGRLPPADIRLCLSVAGQGRQAALEARSAAGERLLELLGPGS